MLRSQSNSPSSAKVFSVSSDRSRATSPQLSIWVRLGIPAALACTAGWLNANLIRQQLDPTEAFALRVDVAPGIQLKPEFFDSIKVGGTLNRTVLLTRPELLSGMGKLPQPARTLEAALRQSPLVFSRFLKRGELLTDACFGDRELLADDERVIQVPLSKVRGDCSHLVPGQIVYLDAINRDSSNGLPAIQEIGPFRVAVSLLSENQSKAETFLSLVTRLGPHGQLSTHAELLRAAAYSDSSISLALIEKSTLRRSPDKAILEPNPTITPDAL